MGKEEQPNLHRGTLRWYIGMMIATAFSLVFLVAPFYMLSSIVFIALQFPTRNGALLYATPLLLSIISRPLEMQWLVHMLTPMLDYFQYEEEFEMTQDEVRDIIKKGRKYILCMQPHGVISFCSFCAAIHTPPDLLPKTAVASAVLKTPLIKNLVGIFGLIDASKASLKKFLKEDRKLGVVVLYVGGIAEIFKCSRREERLFLSQRKGFIKLALSEGYDVVPAYLFGNTSVLTVLKYGPLASLSRKLQASLTWYWGKWYLPIPRDDKCMYVRGKPLNLPHIPEPAQEDIDKWHAKYCEEVTRLFDKYKEKLPMYKHKTLFID